jgi:hypothetical protein
MERKLEIREKVLREKRNWFSKKAARGAVEEMILKSGLIVASEEVPAYLEDAFDSMCIAYYDTSAVEDAESNKRWAVANPFMHLLPWAVGSELNNISNEPVSTRGKRDLTSSKSYFDPTCCRLE